MQRITRVVVVAGLLMAACTQGTRDAGPTAVPSTTSQAPTTTSQAPTTTSQAPTTTTEVPRSSPCGDSYLDGLHEACADRDWEACDELFRNAPAWSVCEGFGDTCGNTTTTPRDARCQDLYAGINLPPTDWPGIP